jgi:hypothetical protein
LTLRRGILYRLSVNPIQDKGTESRDESDFHRDMPFPGFEVDPGQIEGARSSHVEEMPETKSGYDRIRWWVWPGEDPLFDSWLGYVSTLLFVGLGLMLLDVLGVLGERCVIVVVLGPMLGVFVVLAVARFVWKRRAARRQGNSRRASS